MGLFDKIFGSSTKQTVEMEYPETCQGYTINYSDPFHEPCPTRGCTTYQTYEERTYCYCPKCKTLLIHY